MSLSPPPWLGSKLVLATNLGWCVSASFFCNWHLGFLWEFFIFMVRSTNKWWLKLESLSPKLLWIKRISCVDLLRMILFPKKRRNREFPINYWVLSIARWQLNFWFYDLFTILVPRLLISLIFTFNLKFNSANVSRKYLIDFDILLV